MRVAGKGVVAALAALIVGLVVSFVAAAWLRSAAPDANVVWRVAKPGQVAVWTLSGAHGAALEITTSAGVSDDLTGRLGDLIGRDAPSISTRNVFALRLAPLLVLLASGLVLAVAMRAAGARSVTEASTGAAAAAAVYGMTLAALAAVSSARLGFDGRFVQAGVEAKPVVVQALLGGVVLGGAFALIGALSSPAMSESLAPLWRGAIAGLRRAFVAGGIAADVGVVLLGATRGGGGHVGGNSSLHVLAVVLLSINFVAAALVLSHGATMHASFDVGPLSGVKSLGYTTSSLGPQRWLLVAVPALAGVMAGRAMRKRAPNVDPVNLALAFGACWGVVLAVLAVLLRVNIVANFSIVSFGGDSGGTASVNALVALLTGFGWGAVTSYLGASSIKAVPLTVPVAHAPADVPVAQVPSAQVPAGVPVAHVPAVCGSCGADIPADDRFCASCGAPR